jgi:hypothetical protein
VNQGTGVANLLRMRTRFDILTIVFGLLILVAVTAGVIA